MLLYTPEAEALRAMLRDVFVWNSVDGHDPPDGWLIFELPPSELGVHPAEEPRHEVTLMCRDIGTTVAELRSKGVEIPDEPKDMGFGSGERFCAATTSCSSCRAHNIRAELRIRFPEESTDRFTLAERVIERAGSRAYIRL